MEPDRREYEDVDTSVYAVYMLTEQTPNQFAFFLNFIVRFVQRESRVIAIDSKLKKTIGLYIQWLYEK